MSVNTLPVTHLKMVHAKITFAYLKASLNRPTRKGYPQQPFEGYLFIINNHIRQKVLHLLLVKHIAGNDQRMRSAGQPFFTMLAVKLNGLNFPYYRPFVPLLYFEPLPFLLIKLR